MKNRPPRDLSRAAAGGQVAECGAVLRMLAPLSASPESTVERQRRLLVDVFRMIGDRLLETPGRATVIPQPTVPTRHATQSRADVLRDTSASLSPRLRQTLNCLLAGQSEKEAARQLGLSPHTVHVYVKELYRRYGVSSRAELLARHVHW